MEKLRIKLYHNKKELLIEQLEAFEENLDLYRSRKQPNKRYFDTIIY